MDPNDPALASFVEVEPASHFPIQNLPFGVFSTAASSAKRVGVAIGDSILDLAVLEREGVLSAAAEKPVFAQARLNDFIALGRSAWRETRARVSELLRADDPRLRDNLALRQEALVPASSARMHLPVEIGGYTDF